METIAVKIKNQCCVQGGELCDCDPSSQDDSEWEYDDILKESHCGDCTVYSGTFEELLLESLPTLLNKGYSGHFYFQTAFTILEAVCWEMMDDDQSHQKMIIGAILSSFFFEDFYFPKTRPKYSGNKTIFSD